MVSSILGHFSLNRLRNLSFHKSNNLSVKAELTINQRFVQSESELFTGDMSEGHSFTRKVL